METSVATPLSAAVLARDRVLPVADVLQGLLPSGGLVRGQLVGCSGLASRSLAFALAAAAMDQGSWLAVVDVDGLGADAIADLGVPLGRVVRVETGGAPQRWADGMAAVLDGFELVATTPPARAAGLWSRLQRRVATRHAVVLAIDPAGAPVDVTLTVRGALWHHAGSSGCGHLAARRAIVQSSGRRVPVARTVDVWLPDATGQLRHATEGSAPVLQGRDGGMAVAG